MSNRRKPRTSIEDSRCSGCDAQARYLDTPGGREWYLPHDVTCPTLDDRQRATAVTVGG